MFNTLNKNRLALTAVLILSNSIVQASNYITPDLYHLQGGGLTIDYDTTGFDGKAHLRYKSGNQVLNFSGDEIRTIGTEVGTLVSVTIKKTIDADYTTFSIVIPHVNLENVTDSATITTEGINTKHKFSIIPNLNKGQTDIYKFTALSGKASFVFF